MQRYCEYSFVSCFPTPSSYTAKFWSVFFFFFNARWFLFCLLPKWIPIPKNTFSICLFLPLSLLLSFTLLDLLSPIGSQNDTTASMLFSSLLPISARLIFWVLTSRGSQASGFSSPVFFSPNVHEEEGARCSDYMLLNNEEQKNRKILLSNRHM